MAFRTLCPTVLLSLLSTAAFAQGEHCDDAWLIEPGPQTADGPYSGEGASQSDATNADWYAFDPETAGYITVGSCGGPRDTRVHIHTGSCGSLTLLGSDDDGCPSGYPPGNSLLANIPVTPGNLYFIEWDDRYTGQGFDWELMFHTCPIAIPSFQSFDNSLLVNWDGLAPGSAYTIEYGLAGFEQGTGQVITGVEGEDGPPVLINGLLTGTTYDVYISMDCGNGDVAPFSGPWHPRTTGALPNDGCGGATAITCGSITNGNTANAADDQAPDCGTGIQAPGLWYTFTGVDGNVVLSTCGLNQYDTRLNVYRGPCEDLQCVDGNDDGQFCSDYASEVTMHADAADTYYVLVQGYDGATGEFGLAMECPTCTAPTDVSVTAGDHQALVTWATHNPSSTFQVEYGPQGFTLGTGQVVTGTVGVDGPPVYIGGLDSLAHYDVYVTEDCGANGLSSTRGPLGFETVAGPLAPNAFCNGALPIDCNQNVQGNTNDGFLALGIDCAEYPITAKGLWYTFTGQGVEVTLYTCDQAAFDTRLNVYSGTCAAPVCVITNDDGANCSGNSSELTFLAQEGVEYFVLVHGYQDATGAFTLSMGCAEPCDPTNANDDCANAVVIVPQPLANCTPVQGTTQCAYDSALPTPPCDPYAPIRDVWFRFNSGPAATHTLTISALTAAGLRAALYTDCGAIGNIGCYDDLSAPLEVDGLTENTDYYLRVWTNSADAAGTFTVCDQADLLTGIGETAIQEGTAWPVPAHDVVNVNGLPMDARTLAVVDAAGRVVRNVPLNGAAQVAVNVAGLAPGAYVLKAVGRSAWSVRVLVD